MKKNKIIFAAAILVLLFASIRLFSFYTVDDTIEEKKHPYTVFALDIPENLTFAEEPVPIDNFDVRERLDRELLVNTYWQSQTILFIKRANRWFPTIEKILKKNGVPDDFKYLAIIESGLMNVVSPAGASGFWQILKNTGKEYGLEITNDIDERYHVEKSTEVACKYLKQAYNKFGSWSLAAASYNMGITGLEKQIQKQRVKSYYDLHLNEETARYLYRIIVAKEIISNPEKYGFKVKSKDKYQPIPTREVEVATNIDNLVDFSFQHGVNLKILRVFNPWIRNSSLLITPGKKYIIKIPKDTTNLNVDVLNYTIDSLLMDSTIQENSIKEVIEN
jgi:membrane-bound lytic murein transglycosylase D